MVDDVDIYKPGLADHRDTLSSSLDSWLVVHVNEHITPEVHIESRGKRVQVLAARDDGISKITEDGDAKQS